MRNFVYMLGVACIVAGTIFFLQGINVIPGSFMTGRSEWAFYGGIIFLAGIVLTASAVVRNRKG